MQSLWNPRHRQELELIEDTISCDEDNRDPEGMPNENTSTLVAFSNYAPW